jgi:hypothetical protein
VDTGTKMEGEARADAEPAARPTAEVVTAAVAYTEMADELASVMRALSEDVAAYARRVRVEGRRLAAELAASRGFAAFAGLDAAEVTDRDGDKWVRLAVRGTEVLLTLASEHLALLSPTSVAGEYGPLTETGEVVRVSDPRGHRVRT